MAGDIVNLKRFRKKKARSEKDAAASVSRARFGQTKAVRRKNESDYSRDNARHAGHKLTDDDA